MQRNYRWHRDSVIRVQGATKKNLFACSIDMHISVRTASHKKYRISSTFKFTIDNASPYNNDGKECMAF